MTKGMNVYSYQSYLSRVDIITPDSRRYPPKRDHRFENNMLLEDVY